MTDWADKAAYQARVGAQTEYGACMDPNFAEVVDRHVAIVLRSDPGRFRERQDARWREALEGVSRDIGHVNRSLWSLLGYGPSPLEETTDDTNYLARIDRESLRARVEELKEGLRELDAVALAITKRGDLCVCPPRAQWMRKTIAALVLELEALAAALEEPTDDA